MPEPCAQSSDRRFWLQRLSVPTAARGTFVRAAAAAFAGFAVAGLVTAISPAFLREILGLSNVALAGAVVFSQSVAAVTGQFALRRLDDRSALPVGCAGLVAGAALVLGGLAASSLELLLAGIVIAGVGQGMSFGAGLAAVTAESPPKQRSEVGSSFFVVAYVALSVPIIGVGIAAEAFGLRSAGIGFTALVAALAFAVPISLVKRDRGRRAAAPRQ